MLHNYIAVALRNIARNPLYAAISVFGLAVGICAALLAAFVVHSEYHYDRFIPEFERTYLIVHIGSGPLGSRTYSDSTSSRTARHIELHAAGVEAVARTSGWADVYLRHAALE